MGTLKVVYKREKRGWVARVKTLRRCRGTGKTIREARDALRHSLEDCVENPYQYELLEDVQLPQGARATIAKHWAVRRKAEAAEAKAREATGAAVKALIGLKLNIKDAADLLGVSLPQARKLMLNR